MGYNPKNSIDRLRLAPNLGWVIAEMGAQIIAPRLLMCLSPLYTFIFVFFMRCLLFSADRFLHLAEEEK